MPHPRRPHVASADEVKITRDGDCVHIEYADPKIPVARLQIGAEKLATMSDAALLEFWNDSVQAAEDLVRSEGDTGTEVPVGKPNDAIEASEDLVRSQSFTATEVPVGKPQVKYQPLSDQWVPRGHVVRAAILSDAAVAVGLEKPFISIDDRRFTVAEFVKMVGTFVGWGMRITFVPAGEIHENPRIELREPEEKKRPSKRVKAREG
jgi:hypothetical protein